MTRPDDEFNYTENSFLNLLYPKPFIHFAKSEALKILSKNQSQTAVNTPSGKIRLPINTLFCLTILPLTLLEII